MDYPSRQNHYLVEHANLLADSFQRLIGRPLINNMDQHALPEQLFHAPFALVSHDTAADPVFNYANLTALKLFAMDWAEFTQLPSRFSAEPVNQSERARLLAEVTAKGYIDHYQGVRIAKNGERFVIKNAVVWNVIDKQGVYRGQAACFEQWQSL